MLSFDKERYRVNEIYMDRLIIGESPPPDARLVNSIRQWGILEPLIVRPYRDKFKIIAGNRRAKAMARLAEELDLKIEEVSLPCLLVVDASLAMAAMVMTNNCRKANPLSDLQAIEDMTTKLMKAGKSQEEIQKAIRVELGIPVGTQRKRLKLASLIPELRIAITENRLAPTSAERIASLDKKKQQRLYKLLDDRGEKGRITAKDVKEAICVQVSEYTTKLPWDQLAPPANGDTE